MVASDRSTEAVWATDWLVGGDGWPADQLPPATSRSRPTLALRWASATNQPRMSGLLVPLGDALLGQDLAQPSMLVVHVSFLPAAQLLPRRQALVAAGQLRMVLW
jgi:hypothetical protein